jgi:hypothetical protein
VLVLVPREVVLAVHVSPVYNSWEDIVAVDIPCIWNSLSWSICEIRFLNSASASSWLIEELVVLDLWHLVQAGCWVENWLREGIYSLVIQWIAHFSSSGNVPLLVGPSINWSSP